MSKMLTPADLAAPGTISGYRYVLRDDGSRVNGHGGTKVAFQSDLRRLPVNIGRSYGPRRSTALECAQDICDYVNGANVVIPASRKTAGHNGKRDSLPMSDEVQEALGILRDARAARKGKQGYVYLIVEDRPGGGLRYGKIGFSTNPPARVAELQTGNPRPLKLLYMKPGTEADESALHNKYNKYNCLQEWFWITRDLLLEWDASHAVR